LSILTACLVGIFPAWQASAPEFGSLLKSHGTSRVSAPRGYLVSGQVGLSLVLLVSAVLFVRSLRAGLRADLGFDPRPLAAVSFDPFLYGYDGARAVQYCDRAMQGAAALPGVSAVAVTRHVPLAPLHTLPVDQIGGGRPAGGGFVAAGLNSITPAFFKVLDIPMVAGRAFTNADAPPARRVAIVNQSAAALFFPGETALGKELVIFDDRITIVGIVRDSKYATLHERQVPLVFQPMAQDPSVGDISLVVRAANPRATLTALRDVLRPIDPNMPLHDERLVADQIDEVLMPQRFGATLLGLFAFIALAVATVGIYGTITYTVSQRTREIGVRIALGARAADILRTVLARSGRAVGVGIIVGLAGGALASRALVRFLYGVQPIDLTSFMAALVLLAAGALVAAVVPARRALRTDPASAMRAE
jgi:predicted permease